MFEALPPCPQIFAQRTSAMTICVSVLLFYSAMISPVSVGVSNTEKKTPKLKTIKWKKLSELMRMTTVILDVMSSI